MSKIKRYAEDEMGEDEFYTYLDEEMEKRGYESEI